MIQQVLWEKVSHFSTSHPHFHLANMTLVFRGAKLSSKFALPSFLQVQIARGYILVNEIQMEMLWRGGGSDTFSPNLEGTGCLELQQPCCQHEVSSMRGQGRHC